MEGAIVIIVVLLLFPVVALIGMSLLAAGLGAFIKTSVDAEHEGSIELEMANFDPYDGPVPTDD